MRQRAPEWYHTSTLVNIALPVIMMFVTPFLTGAVINVFISICANHFYALRHGARLPAEGVPFISLAVALLYGVSALVFFFFHFIPYVLADSMRPVKENERMFQRLVADNAARFVNILWLIAILWLAVYLFVPLYAPVLAPILEIPFQDWHPWKLLILTMIAFGVGWYLHLVLWEVWDSSRYPYRLPRLYTALTTLYVIANLLFVPGRYDGFLRIIRFGGGLETTIHRNDKGPVTAFLFLYTEKRIILYVGDKNSFLEIPATDVQSIEYGQFPKWKLPEVKLGEQLQYVR
jgi:hypothetical protein